ncbi:Protease-associated domain, PA and Transferrin receptor-like, dimerisation domain and Peptidase M28 domain-containing protein [Strongyloides ratti]|uniref:Protease-associated domain, PA and Transferrin receptor-like, dimerisation domain and Peptidase M28 domain-containing protein n=1 Tax=Strongyloides ratti TaxID=34506 RepID=A0A090L2F5_STRRB|nr:Protease-associated domain, PA and Transferrin receptor-like, dimerisation domain and Peptidase M28 domain-containing protein [Strongyloides ratti]CEF62267.1 Protease-associated domain, PA and Transferrin receptor-like, dimerisation domain and Peptidase M28 domain-containing protein [Strongyloides ratti]
MPYVNKDPYAGRLINPQMKKALISLFLGMACVFFVGMLAIYHKKNPIITPEKETVDGNHKIISKSILNNIKGENIKNNLRLITTLPHVAGTEANNNVGDKIAKLWKENGLQDVHFIEYEVLLNYPDYQNPNIMSIISGDGKIVYQTKGVSPVIIPSEQSAPDAGIQWVAYSANGTASGDIVYCHYGRIEDFQLLKEMGISLKGKIALLRYGYSFRGDKVKLAQDNGAIGAILYSDPGEVAKAGTEKSKVYPNTEWMPHEGVQRGSLSHSDGGDPLSPIYPSKSNLYKSRSINDAIKDRVLPNIPVLPLSYMDAQEILKRLSGNRVPYSWQGGFPFIYHIGPGFKSGNEKVKIDVRSNMSVKKIRNVIGYIHGYDEPDKYVILGNHYDAWVYGSLDPNSGTAVLAEVGRAMVETINATSWKPSRTIMFCAWDAEEYLLIGSTEFVEEFTNILQNRAVVYLNVDTIFSNQTLHVRTIPTLFDVSIEAAKLVRNPIASEKRKGRMTLFDTWIYNFPDKKNSNRPSIPVPGGGSDMAPFLNYAGIPVIDFNYRNISWEEYPLYHTLYETPFTNEHIFDTNNFAVHKAVGQYWAELARRFADSAILPINATALANALLNDYLPELKKALGTIKYKNGIDGIAKEQYQNLYFGTKVFMKECKLFENIIEDILYDFAINPFDQRRISSINNRLTSIDKCFINPRGIPGKESSRHVLYSLSDNDSYSSVTMASVFDIISKIKIEKHSEVIKELEKKLAEQISIVHYSVICATNTLKLFI